MLLFARVVSADINFKKSRTHSCRYSEQICCSLWVKLESCPSRIGIVKSKCREQHHRLDVRRSFSPELHGYKEKVSTATDSAFSTSSIHNSNQTRYILGQGSIDVAWPPVSS
jgi:hypothetical protein